MDAHRGARPSGQGPRVVAATQDADLVSDRWQGRPALRQRRVRTGGHEEDRKPLAGAGRRELVMTGSKDDNGSLIVLKEPHLELADADGHCFVTPPAGTERA